MPASTAASDASGSSRAAPTPAKDTTPWVVRRAAGGWTYRWNTVTGVAEWQATGRAAPAEQASGPATPAATVRSSSLETTAQQGLGGMLGAGSAGIHLHPQEVAPQHGAADAKPPSPRVQKTLLRALVELGGMQEIGGAAVPADALEESSCTSVPSVATTSGAAGTGVGPFVGGGAPPSGEPNGALRLASVDSLAARAAAGAGGVVVHREATLPQRLTHTATTPYSEDLPPPPTPADVISATFSEGVRYLSSLKLPSEPSKSASTPTDAHRGIRAVRDSSDTEDHEASPITVDSRAGTPAAPAGGVHHPARPAMSSLSGGQRHSFATTARRPSTYFDPHDDTVREGAAAAAGGCASASASAMGGLCIATLGTAQTPSTGSETHEPPPMPSGAVDGCDADVAADVAAAAASARSTPTPTRPLYELGDLASMERVPGSGTWRHPVEAVEKTVALLERLEAVLAATAGGPVVKPAPAAQHAHGVADGQHTITRRPSNPVRIGAFGAAQAAPRDLPFGLHCSAAHPARARGLAAVDDLVLSSFEPSFVRALQENVPQPSLQRLAAALAEAAMTPAAPTLERHAWEHLRAMKADHGMG